MSLHGCVFLSNNEDTRVTVFNDLDFLNTLYSLGNINGFDADSVQSRKKKVQRLIVSKRELRLFCTRGGNRESKIFPI